MSSFSCFPYNWLTWSLSIFDFRFTIRFSVFRPRDENPHRRLDPVNRRKAALVCCEPKMSARVNIQKRFLQGHIAEGANEGHIHFGVADSHAYVLAPPVAQLEKVFSTDIGDQVSEGAIRGDDLTGQTTFIQVRGHKVEPNQLADVEFRTNLCPVFTVGKMRTCRGKNIASVERGRQRRADHPVTTCDLAGAFDSIAIL